MKIGDQIATPRIVEKTMRRKDGTKFTGYQVLFGKSYTAFDKVLFTMEEAREYIILTSRAMPGINRLHSAIF